MKTNFKFPDRRAPNYTGVMSNKQDHSEIYREAFEMAKDKFGENSLAYKAITNKINKEDVNGSQYFWNTWLNQSGLLIPKRVMNLNDWENALSNDPEIISGFYTDTPQLVLRTSQASWKPNQHLINDLTRKLNGTTFKGAKFNEFTAQNPLIITGAKLKESKAKNNQYGLILNLEDANFEYDPRLAHGKTEIELGNQKKNLWTKENGVSRLFLYADDLLSNYDDLSDSYSSGRVAFIDAEGVQDFENYMKILKKEKEKSVEILENRFENAKKVLKGQKI